MSVYGGNFRNVNNIRQAGGADIPPCIEEKDDRAKKGNIRRNLAKGNRSRYAADSCSFAYTY